MADKHSKEARSFNMSRVKNKNTQPELQIRQFLFSKGFRYRIHDKKLPGKPDIVLPKYKAVIFINGCFWHGHDSCKYFTIPKTRTEWWQDKIKRNVLNDATAKTALENAGWIVIVIWSCELKSKSVNETLTSLAEKIRDSTENI